HAAAGRGHEGRGPAALAARHPPRRPSGAEQDDHLQGDARTVSTHLVPGRVSVVVVNFRGAEDTIACLESMRDLDYPELEVIVVDNASGDGSAEVLTARFPDARVLALDVNTGFAGGCNHGAAQATGQYVAFLNNDARPDPAWLTEAVGAL